VRRLRMALPLHLLRYVELPAMMVIGEDCRAELARQPRIR
jgi:hypothetical protein